MRRIDQRRAAIDTGRFSILSPLPPFVDICLRSAAIGPLDFPKIAQLAAAYPNDARLIEMVRAAGDASAKVPYLLDEDETPQSILGILREVARPQLERLHRLPEALQATVRMLLSINTLPNGYELYAIAALLEIDRMQEEMIRSLRGLMAGRLPALDFYRANLDALHALDRDWPRLRRARTSRWRGSFLPEQARMSYQPLFNNERLTGVHETCAILPPPHAGLLERLTPDVLRRPLPPQVPVPVTGSADWLIRDVGKVGRHFTRALLRIIKDHLEAERVALEPSNYALIDRRAQEALEEFVKRTP